MPPVSPPLSLTTVLPAMPHSKREGARPSALLQAASSPVLAKLCSPSMLLQPLTLPARPPGFEASPTPPLISNGSPRRTPLLVRLRRAAADLQPAGVGLALLFEERQGHCCLPLLEPPLRPPAARRKTLAGVNISRTSTGLSLHRM